MKLKQKKRGYAPLGNMPASVVVAMGDSMDDEPVFGQQSVIEEPWELLFEEGFEGAGIPAGWYAAGGVGDYDNSEAPISGSQSLMLDGVLPNWGEAGYGPSGGGLLSHRQLRLTYKIKLSAVSAGYQGLLKISGAVSDYLMLYLNGTNGLDIASYNSVEQATTATKLAANTVYELQHVVKGIKEVGYHALSVNGVEEARVLLNPNKELRFTTLFFTNNFCKQWLDDVKLEGIP